MRNRNKMETQEKIRRIIEFMNIPDFEQIMSAKLLELEISLRPQIKHFQELKTKFKKMVDKKMILLENEEPIKRERAYYFELKRVKDRKPWLGQKWMIWEIDPEPMDGDPEAVLNELAQSMGSCPTDSTKIEYKEILSMTSQRYFDISFTKFSNTYAFGALRQNYKKVEKCPVPDYNNMIKLNLGYKKFNKEDSYGELLRYLEAYPEIRERLLAYFFMMEKPTADNTLAKAG